jgi:hypothetical protein
VIDRNLSQQQSLILSSSNADSGRFTEALPTGA